MRSELLNCQWCKGAPNETLVRHPVKGWQVECVCGARGPGYSDKAGAESAWNRRTLAAGVDGVGRDREADRARFPDADFNRWLDEGISDCGHIVWHTVGDIADAWAGWDSHRYYVTHPTAQAGEDARDADSSDLSLLDLVGDESFMSGTGADMSKLCASLRGNDRRGVDGSIGPAKESK